MGVPFDKIRRIEDLEKQVAMLDLAVRQGRREPSGIGKRWVYLAITARESVSYPDGDANTYPIIFLDRESNNTEGDHAADDTERSVDPVTYGRTVNGQPLLEGEVCYAYPLPKPVTDGKCRWVLEPLTKIYWGNLNEELTPGGSAEVSVYTPAGVGPDDWIDSGEDRTVYEVLMADDAEPLPVDSKIGFVWYFDRFVMLPMGGAPSATGIPFRNDSGEEVPAYGVMKVVDQVTIGGVDHLTINKPDYDFQRRYLINGGTPVPVDDTSRGHWLESSSFVLYDQGEAAPSGNEWGAWPGQWSLKRERLGFTLFKPTAVAGIALGIQREIVSVLGKFYDDLEQGGSALFKVWMRYDGKKRDTQMMLTAWDWYLNKDEEIAKNTQGELAWYSDKWHVRNAYCAADDTDDAAGGSVESMGSDGSGFPQVFVSVSSSGGYISPSQFQGFDL